MSKEITIKPKGTCLTIDQGQKAEHRDNIKAGSAKYRGIDV